MLLLSLFLRLLNRNNEKQQKKKQPSQERAAHVGDVLRGRVGQAVHAHAGRLPGTLGQVQQVLAHRRAGGQRPRRPQLGETRTR